MEVLNSLCVEVRWWPVSIYHSYYILESRRLEKTSLNKILFFGIEIRYRGIHHNYLLSDEPETQAKKQFVHALLEFFLDVPFLVPEWPMWHRLVFLAHGCGVSWLVPDSVVL